ncbi:hypothetical protein OAO87_04045 [bacterium]|nr:hypothetical protein [bacterium]
MTPSVQSSASRVRVRSWIHWTARDTKPLGRCEQRVAVAAEAAEQRPRRRFGARPHLKDRPPRFRRQAVATSSAATTHRPKIASTTASLRCSHALRRAMIDALFKAYSVSPKSLHRRPTTPPPFFRRHALATHHCCSGRRGHRPPARREPGHGRALEKSRLNARMRLARSRSL